MFTVILYWDTDKETEPKLELNEYDFLFSYTQLQNRLIKKKYSGNLEEIVADLNRDIGHLHDWKLILFDGRLSSGDNAKYIMPDTVRREWNELLRFFSDQKESGNGIELSAFPPVEIWYLSCWKKGLYVNENRNEFARAKILLTKDESEKYFGNESSIEDELVRVDMLDVMNIPSFRMCWSELAQGTSMQRRQQELQICCILQIFVYNDIPAAFFCGGYLYQVVIGLDREALAHYSGKFHQQNLEIQGQCQKAMEEYYEEEQKRARYVRPAALCSVRIDLGRTPIDKAGHKLKNQDLQSGKNIELDNKLKNNQQWLDEELYFFKNRLHSWLVLPVKLEEQNRNVLLDTAGLAYAKTAMENAIRSIHQKCQEEDSPMRVEKGLLERTEKVCHQASLWLSSSERKIIWGTLSLLEGVTFYGFIWEQIREVLSNLQAKFSDFGIVNFVMSIMTAEVRASAGNLIAGCIAVVAIAVVTWIILKIVSWCLNEKVYRQYNNYLYKIFRNQQQKRKNVIELIEEIAQYQYHWTLLDRQMKICAENEHKKQRLLHHEFVRKITADACRHLEQLLGEDEREKEKRILLPDINFSMSPEQMEYYWLPFENNRNTCSLNNTGFEINVVFDFISAFEIHRTLALKLSEWD